MNKKQAIELFGSTRALADALGVTTQAVYRWSFDLSLGLTDRIIGAGARTGRVKTNMGSIPRIKKMYYTGLKIDS